MAYTLVNGDGFISGEGPRLEFVISSEADLADLMANPPFEITVGSIAYTPDLLSIFMFSGEGGWVKVEGGIGGGSSSSSSSSSASQASRVASLSDTELRNGSAVVEVVGIPTYVEDVTQYASYGLTEKGWYVFARITAPSGVLACATTIVTGANAIIAAGNSYVDVAVRFDVAAVAQVVTVHWDGSVTESFVFRATDLATRNLDYRTTFYVYDLSPYVTWAYALTSDTAFAANKRYYTEADGVYTLAEVTAAEAIPAYYIKGDDVYTEATGTFADGVTYYTKDGDVYTAATITVGDAIPAYYTLDNGVYIQATGVFMDGVTYYTKSNEVYTEATVTAGEVIPAYYTFTPGVYTQATGVFMDSETYYIKSNDVYTEATVVVGDAIPAYYNHSKITISGMVRNVTYSLDEIIDCPMEFILPEIEDKTHGCWFEMRFRHAGEYSMTLVPPNADIKIATEHTQKETAGINMIDLHYTVIDDLKIWRFMNTHSSIPT